MLILRPARWNCSRCKLIRSLSRIIIESSKNKIYNSITKKILRLWKRISAKPGPKLLHSKSKIKSLKMSLLNYLEISIFKLNSLLMVLRIKRVKLWVSVKIWRLCQTLLSQIKPKLQTIKNRSWISKKKFSNLRKMEKSATKKFLRSSQSCKATDRTQINRMK